MCTWPLLQVADADELAGDLRVRLPDRLEVDPGIAAQGDEVAQRVLRPIDHNENHVILRGAKAPGTALVNR